MGQEVSSTGLAQAHFLQAARDGDVQKASYVIKRCPKNVLQSAKDSEGRGAILLAASDGRLLFVQFLVSKRFDVHEIDKNEWTALHWAAAEGHVKMVDFLLEKGIDIETRDRDGLTPFLRAVYTGQVEFVEFLVKKGCDISVKSKLGSGALALASVNGHLPLVRLFVSKESDVRETHQNHWTALHCGVAGDHLEIVEFLLDKGAEMEAIDVHGMTPFLTAVHKGRVEMVKLLIKRGCNLLAKTARGNNALTAAVASGCIPALTILLLNSPALKGNVNNTDENGQAALHYASKMGRVEAINFLLENNAAIDAEDKEGYCPIHLAASEGFYRATECLVRNQCDTTKRTQDGHSAIDLARYKGHHHIVRYLVEENRERSGSGAGKASPSERNDRLVLVRTRTTPSRRPASLAAPTPPSASRKAESPHIKSSLEIRQLRERCDKALLLLQDQESRHNSTVKELLRTHERHQMEVEEMERAGEGLQSLVKEQQSRLQVQENELDQLRQTREQLMNSLEAKEYQLAQKAEAYDDLRQQMEGAGREQDDEADMLRARNEELSTTVSRLEAEIEQLDLEKMEADEEAAVAVAQGREMEARLVDAEKMLDAVQSNARTGATREVDRDGTHGRRNRIASVGGMDDFYISVSELQIMMETKLGEGSFGAVVLGYWRGSQVAVKVFSRVTMSEQIRREYERDVLSCARTRHPNVVILCGIVKEGGTAIGQIMEHMESSLTGVIAAARRSTYFLTFRERIDLAIGFLSGIAYLHGLRPHPLLHGDVRSSKILVTSVMTAKVGSVGSSRLADASLSPSSVRLHYLAPERFPDNDGDMRSVSTAADVYSLGVTMVEMWTGQTAELKSRMQQLEGVDNSTLRGLCLAMVDRNSTGRPEAIEALSIVHLLKGNKSYAKCPPKRMVVGRLYGESVMLTEKPWA